MKILIVTIEIGLDGGGLSLSCTKLADVLSRKHTVEIADSTAQPILTASDGALTHLRHSIGMEYKLKTEVEKYKDCDVVIGFGGNFNGYYASLLAYKINAKYVLSLRGSDINLSKWSAETNWYSHKAIDNADKIVVLSNEMKKYFKENYNRDTNFIPNGVNKPILKEPKIIKEKYNLGKEDYILFLARIVPEKGLDYLIEAYNQIKTDKKLVIAGGASHTNNYYENIIQKCKSNPNIILTGFVQGEELQELYSNCFLYCLPSDVEGMPISLLEAMSYGRNCLVSDIDENTQVVENYAYTFKKGSIEDLTNKLDIILKNI